MPSRKIVDGWGFNCLGYKVDANDQVTLLNRVEYICRRFLKNRKGAYYDFVKNTQAQLMDQERGPINISKFTNLHIPKRY